jgi:Ankyrin repeats (3 copies)
MSDPLDVREFRTFLNAVIAGDARDVRRRLGSHPRLATVPAADGATRRGARDFFFPEIRHYLYAGDTALHIAAAAYQREIAKLLIANGADVRARNRMGATPLHYAADANHWNPDAQAETIEYLLSAGADPNVVCKRGVAPLHRAVRTRSAAAVSALLAGGADPRQKNGNGSTPLRLARMTTGKGGSGSAHAREQQALIIRLLA